MKIYISGKIGGVVIGDDTLQKFAKAEEMLKAQGHEVFNPTSERWQRHLRKRYHNDTEFFQPWLDQGEMPDFYTYALLRDMMALSLKDAIYMLPDWLDSKGAKVEHAFAIACGMTVIYDEELYKNGTLRR